MYPETLREYFFIRKNRIGISSKLFHISKHHNEIHLTIDENSAEYQQLKHLMQVKGNLEVVLNLKKAVKNKQNHTIVIKWANVKPLFSHHLIIRGDDKNKYKWMIKLTGNKKLKSVKFDNCFSYCAYDEQDKSQMKKLNKSSKLHFANTGEDKHIWNLQQIWENYMSDTPNQAVFENLAGTDLDSIELRDLVENWNNN